MTQLAFDLEARWCPMASAGRSNTGRCPMGGTDPDSETVSQVAFDRGVDQGFWCWPSDPVCIYAEFSEPADWWYLGVLAGRDMRACA